MAKAGEALQQVRAMMKADAMGGDEVLEALRKMKEKAPDQEL